MVSAKRTTKGGTRKTSWAADRLAELQRAAALMPAAAGPVASVSVVIVPADGGPPVVLTAHAEAPPRPPG